MYTGQRGTRRGENMSKHGAVSVHVLEHLDLGVSSNHLPIEYDTSMQGRDGLLCGSVAAAIHREGTLSRNV